jgi:hypothetical protein
MEIALLGLRLVIGIDMTGTAWALGAVAAGLLGGLGAVLSGRLTPERGGQPDPA